MIWVLHFSNAGHSSMYHSRPMDALGISYPVIYIVGISYLYELYYLNTLRHMRGHVSSQVLNVRHTLAFANSLKSRDEYGIFLCTSGHEHICSEIPCIM